MPEMHFTSRLRASFAATTALTLLAATCAQAQDLPAKGQSATDSPKDAEIIVTGTLIRGIAPVGTNVIGISPKDIAVKGAASTNDLMASIPQMSSFNAYQAPSAGFGQPIATTNLRGLGASGGTTTLLLVNGHRIVGSGILQTYPDPSVIPPNMIERVEVIPDGGSSIYGS
ncbi:MAG TPA: TonB-dependent receptor plug domain-containing protein, partial [Novosphingobium sp.]|nr:TonB-dependent receptor plug domain-containing protein [Novosphingobium sp.]